MSDVKTFVAGLGAVSPAGWGLSGMREALERGEPLPLKDLARPGWDSPLRVRQVPSPANRPAFLGHARLRRSSPIAQYTVASALEALGEDAVRAGRGELRVGVVFCAMSGCVNYSRRFYDEVLKDPMTASPLVFPETVYNSPASHLAAVLGVQSINYTIVGDPGTFLQGLALAAEWIVSDRVDGCVVVGAEELDWLTADSTRLFARKAVVAAGAGAVYLRGTVDGSLRAMLRAVTDSHLYSARQSRTRAVQQARAQLPGNGAGELLCDTALGVERLDAAEQRAWSDWTGARLSPRQILGEGYMAGAAWQCVAALDALRSGRYRATNISVAGTNQQAIAARFEAFEFEEGKL